MGDVKLSSPKVRVVRDGHDDLEVQTDNRDLVAWDMTRVKHRWPKFDEAAFLWMTFVSWSAARRIGSIPAELTFERWRDTVLDVATIEDDDDSDLGSPTQPGPEPG